MAPSLAHHCRDIETITRLGHLIEDWANSTDPLVERGLAKGLRWQSKHRDPDPAVRDRLSGAATTLLAHSSWWSAVALLQALTLWELSRAPGRGLRSSATIDAWLDDHEVGAHDFVRAHRTLCCCTLRTRQPGRFLRIDETLSIRRIGSSAVRPTSEFWLAPTGGWLSLEPRAQRLLADVVLLVDRDGFPDRGEHEDLLHASPGVTPHRRSHRRDERHVLRRGRLHGSLRRVHPVAR